jgi:hypothetical protein
VLNLVFDSRLCVEWLQVNASSLFELLDRKAGGFIV